MSSKRGKSSKIGKSNISNKQLIKRLYGLVRPYRGRLILSMLSMVIVSKLAGAQAYMVKPLLDKIFVEQDATLLNILPLALILIFLIKGVFYYIYRYLLESTGRKVIRDVRKMIFGHIHALPVAFFHKTPTGELISRVVSDVGLIQGAISKAIVSGVKDMVQMLVLLGVVFYLDWRMALVTFILLPVATVPTVRFGKKYRRNSLGNQKIVALISGALHETIGGQRIVKAFGMEGYEKRRFSDLVDRLCRILTREIQLKSLQHPIMELIGGVALAGIIWYGGHQVLSGNSTPGTFIAFLTAMFMLYEPVKSMSGLSSIVMHGVAAAERVFGLLDVKPDITDKPGALELTPFQRAIEFDRVSFSYDGKEPVLSDINLTVPAGEVLAIVGPSGGGKTTLVNLIPRFFDVDSGRLLIDGHDVRDLTVASLRAQISIVEQQTVLFNDTVRNNIAYGDLERSEEEIIAAAKAAFAYNFIQELPQGFDTPLGEAGARLSGGQRQRLAIARALLKNAPILILDEATSALDTESEREVQKALENLMVNRTTLIIAHRLTTIKNADRIIVMQDGRIVEEGNHESLMGREVGVYKTLHDQ